MLILGQDAGKLKEALFKSFDMKDWGSARQGMQIRRDRKARKLWLSQEKSFERVLERFNMKNAKSTSPPLLFTSPLGIPNEMDRFLVYGNG